MLYILMMETITFGFWKLEINKIENINLNYFGDDSMNEYNRNFWEALNELVSNSEIKILIGCTEEEKNIIYKTHNETQFMKGILISR